MISTENNEAIASCRMRHIAIICVSALLLLGVYIQAHAQSIAITFDDGFHKSSLGEQALKDNQKVLSTLKQHGVTSMLFPTGTALDNPDNMALITAWSRAGHALGNHTFSHRALSETDTNQYLSDIQKSHNLLSSMKGWCQRLRFPYLDEGKTPEQRNQVMQWLATQGYGVAAATIATRDWEFDAQYQDLLKTNNQSLIKQFKTEYLGHLLKEINTQRTHWKDILGREPSHVLLLHTNHLNAEILNQLLSQLKTQGWQIVSPGTAFSDPIYQRSYTTDSANPTTTTLSLPNPTCY